MQTAIINVPGAGTKAQLARVNGFAKVTKPAGDGNGPGGQSGHGGHCV